MRRVGASPWTGQSQARSATHGATKPGSQERQQPPAVRKGAGDSPCKRRRWAGREAAPAVCGQRGQHGAPALASARRRLWESTKAGPWRALLALAPLGPRGALAPIGT